MEKKQYVRPMIKSKAWDWSKNESDEWLVPSLESCYLAESWKSKGFKKFLDLGCGLGRHSIYFAQKGYDVNSVDLSGYGINYLKNWAGKEKLNIKAEVCDMISLPFNDNTFDCIMAYNVIYHTDIHGFLRSLDEISRILKCDGELFITLLSKGSLAYRNSDNNKHIDDNTILRDENDTGQCNVPHFYVNINDVEKFFAKFDFIHDPVEQIEYDKQGNERMSRHFNLIVRKK